MCMAPDVSCSSAPSQGFKRSLEDDVGEEMELQATDDSSKRSRSAPATGKCYLAFTIFKL